MRARERETIKRSIDHQQKLKYKTTKNLIKICDLDTKCRIKVLHTSSSHLGWKSDAWIPLKASEDQFATNKK